MWWGGVKNIGNLDKRVKNGSDCRSRERMERQRKERGWGQSLGSPHFEEIRRRLRRGKSGGLTLFSSLKPWSHTRCEEQQGRRG